MRTSSSAEPGGCGGVRLRVRMRNSRVFSLSTTVRATRGSRAARLPGARGKFGRSVLPAPPAAGLRRRCPRWKSTASAARSPPHARRCRRTARTAAAPASEARFQRGAAPARADSPTLVMPSSASRASMTLPTPGSRPTASGVRKSCARSGRITNRPSGLRQSEAILARNLLRSHARRCGQRQFPRGCSRGWPAPPRWRWVGPACCADVEIGLVQRQRLDQVGMAREDLAHLRATPRL
jgi:hypothetical protein